MEFLDSFKNFFEKIMKTMNDVMTKAKEGILKLFSRFNINKRFQYNLHKMLYSKKKRTRKKYAKLVFKAKPA